MTTTTVLGNYHAVSCRDAASLERDGEPYVAVSELSTSGERRQCEVQFADGIWHLADPVRDLVPAF